MNGTPAHAEGLASLIGPARLAFSTPVREYPPLADRKASALLAANALILSVMIFLTQSIRAAIGSSTLAAITIGTLVAVLIVLVLAGALIAYRGMVYPIPPMPRSLAYFRDVAAMERDAYRAAMAGASYRQVVRDMLDYNYSVASQCIGKFARVNRAVSLFRITVPLWMLLMLCLSLLGATPTG
jgi:hypothetical protein